jgi:hypothetical protein
MSVASFVWLTGPTVTHDNKETRNTCCAHTRYGLGRVVSFRTHSRGPCVISRRPKTEGRLNNLTMMPIGVPKVAYRVPGAPQADWVDIYNRLYRERIIFLGQEIDDEISNQIIAVMLYLDSEDNTKVCLSLYPSTYIDT